MTKIILLLLTLNFIHADDFRISKTLDKFYIKECGSCHMAFQPELLNKNSWVLMMDNLSNHFGTDASLDSSDTKKIKEYLTKNATSREMRNPDNVIAISKMPWFLKEHRKISPKTLAHEKIKSFSNCVACHTQANSGDYDEDNIKIPGQSWLHH